MESDVKNLKKDIKNLEKVLESLLSVQKQKRDERLKEKRQARGLKKLEDYQNAVTRFAETVLQMRSDVQKLPPFGNEFSFVTDTNQLITFNYYANFIVCHIYDPNTAISAAAISRCSTLDNFNAEVGIRCAYKRALTCLNKKLNNEDMEKGEMWHYMA
ncbi:hypothetical protein M0R01_04880 [bacterium]|jgi:hypothetical protein|nr:hypothetical protein [bacterium]